MRKGTNRKKQILAVSPLIFKHCEPATNKRDEWEGRIIGMYFSMIDHKFKDSDLLTFVEFICLCRVIASVAKMQDFNQFVCYTTEVMFAPYRRRVQNGKWIFTTDECDTIKDRMMALAEALSAMPLLTIKFAGHDVKKQVDRFHDQFKRDALVARHLAS